MLRLLPIALVLVFAAVLPARAEDTALGGMSFLLPAEGTGWMRTAGDATGLALRKDLPPLATGRGGGSALIMIRAPHALGSASFAEAFAGFTRLDALPDGRPLLTRSGITVNGHTIAWVQRCCRARNGVYADAHFIGIDSPRGSVFAMLLMIGTRRESAASLKADFAALVRSLRPARDDRGLDFTPAPGDAGLEGAYTSLETGLRPNSFGGVDFFADNNVLLFGRGGVFARAVPPGGRNLADFCRERPSDCGFYRLSHGVIIMDDVQNEYGMLKREEKPLARGAADLSIGEQRWRRVVPFPAGTRLDGSWRYLLASSGQGASSSGGVTVERVLTLTSDNRFSRTGFTGFSGSTEADGARTSIVTGSRRPVTSGTYRLDGLLLHLAGEDGRTETLSVFRPAPGSDGLLVVDGDNYLRRNNAAPPAGKGLRR